jgi:hypothetical protein
LRGTSEAPIIVSIVEEDIAAMKKYTQRFQSKEKYEMMATKLHPLRMALGRSSAHLSPSQS